MNMQWQEQIDAYLQGSLPEEEKQHFEKLLQTNADLSEEVEMHRLMVEAICAERKAALKRLLDNTPVPQGHTFDWLSAQWWRWGAGVVAVGGALGLVIWSNHHREVEQMRSSAATAFVAEPPAPVIEKQASEESREEMTEAKNTERLTPLRSRKEFLQLEIHSTPKAQEAQQELPVQEQVQSNVSEATEHVLLVKELPVSEEEKALQEFEQTLYYQYNNRVLVLFKEVDYRLLQNIDLGDGVKDYIFVNNHFYEMKETGNAIENFENCRVTDSMKIQLLQKYLKP